MSELGGDLFDLPIPATAEILTFNQFWRLFYEYHWKHRKESTRADALCRYIVAYFYGRQIQSIHAQDVDNLIAHLRDRHHQGAWSLIKARSIVRLIYNKAEAWREDGGIGEHDLTHLSLPRRNPGKSSTPIHEPPPIESLSPWEWRIWIRLAKRLKDDELVSALRIGVWGRISPIDLLELNDGEIFDEAMEIRLFRRHTRTPKNPRGCLQVIKLTERFWAELQRLRRFRKPGETKLFAMVNRKRRMAKVRKLARAEGINIRFRLQLLRRSGAQRLKDIGVDDKTNADGMGLTTPKVLQRRYAVGLSPHLRKNTGSLVKEFDA